MKKLCNASLWIAVAVAVGSAWVGAQQTKPSPGPAPVEKIEGEVTSAVSVSVHCSPTFTLKTTEGKEYTIHLGPLQDSEGKVFNPKLGERIRVTGSTCCEMQGTTMIHSSEITVAGRTFRAPAGQTSEGMMCQGMTGQGAMPCCQGTMSCCGMGGTGPGAQHEQHQ